MQCAKRAGFTDVAAKAHRLTGEIEMYMANDKGHQRILQAVNADAKPVLPPGVVKEQWD